jgi:RimJ/RimL family protein N-acetyltransferase
MIVKAETTARSGQSATPETFAIVRGNESMISFIMAIERLPGFEDLVGRWDEAQHRSALGDGRHAYFVARSGSEPVGFAILRDWNSLERVTLVKRIVVSHPGRGYGRLLLSKVIDAAFEETNAWRVWLGVFPENIRAHRAYEAVGFQGGRSSAWQRLLWRYLQRRTHHGVAAPRVGS